MNRIKSLLSRLFWFGIGGLLSVWLNLIIFKFLLLNAYLPNWSAIALSFGIVTILNLFWNYYVNFKTHRNWRQSLTRYFFALGFCFLAIYFLMLYGFHLFNNGTIGRKQWIAGIVQVFGAGLKFLVYHFWVYPEKKPCVPTSENCS